MMLSCGLSMVLSLLSASDFDGIKELAKLQGTWVFAWVDGRKVDIDDNLTTLVISGNQLDSPFFPHGATLRRITPMMKTLVIEVHTYGRSSLWEWCYDVTEDQLRLAGAADGQVPRDFASDPKAGTILRRHKP